MPARDHSERLVGSIRRDLAGPSERDFERVLSDQTLFFRSWLRNPLRAGTFKTSGAALAKAIAAQVEPTTVGRVVELGPGTGTVTAALVEGGVDQSRLVLIESDPNFCALLRQRWPRALVLQEDAYTLPAMARRFDGPVAAIVSGLPLLVRSPEERLRLVVDSLRSAAPEALFVQITYSFRSPVSGWEAELRAHHSPIIWSNVLPARVWVYRLAERYRGRYA
jgi:phosphatidylethanolamine/phosphatidyl-N-methylethanolamine N-methyltransferase